jgi:aminoglycoside 2'-N-acetyltransferase I
LPINFSMTTRFDIRVRRTHQIDAATRVAIVELCTAAHNKDFSRLFFHLPADSLHFVAYHADQIVSHAVVTTRWVQPEWVPNLRTAYVEAVATLPAYQRRGYGSAVMHELVAHITDYDLACLETDRPAFYEQLDWQRWRGRRVGRAPDGSLIPTPEQQNIMILCLPNTPPLDLDRLLTIEAQAGRIW